MGEKRTNRMTNWYSFERDLNIAPQTEGVYLLGDSSEKVIYAGRADNLRQRLSEHPDPENPCLQRKRIEYFAIEQTFYSERRERELIRIYNPECNRTQ